MPYIENSHHLLGENDGDTDAEHSIDVDAIFDHYKPRALTDLSAETVDAPASAEQRQQEINTVVSLLGRRLEGGDEQTVHEYREKKDELFSSLGFKPYEANEILRSWASYSPDRSKVSLQEERQNRLEAFQNNLEAMAQIETLELGGAAELYRTYGIRNFQRYYPDELVRQLKAENTGSVEVIVTSSDDWNGSFSNREAAAQARQDVLMESPIYIEAARPIEAFLRLARVKEMHGTVERIMVNAHGNDDSLEFRSQNAAIDVDSLRRNQAFQQLIEQGILEPDAAILLSSCEGLKLAKEVSAQTQGMVVASGTETEGLYQLDKEGRRYVNRSGPKAKLYERGKRIDGVRRIRTVGRRLLSATGIRPAA